MLCDVFDSAKDVTNLSSNVSDVGVGNVCRFSQSARYFFMPTPYVLVVEGASPASKYVDVHSSVQRCEVQSGCSIITSCSSSNGRGAGLCWACGSNEQNNSMLFRDKASAIVLCLPGRCVATSSHW